MTGDDLDAIGKKTEELVMAMQEPTVKMYEAAAAEAQKAEGTAEAGDSKPKGTGDDDAVDVDYTKKD